MKSFTYWFYNIIVVPLLYILFFLGQLFISKIRKGAKGRKKLFKRLEKKLLPLEDKSPRFWIHSSSMGEFEQAKPIIRLFKEKYPQGCVIASLFSPSALEHIGDNQEADCLCYLPFDSIKRAQRFISLINPSVAVVIRHDIWPNHLWELKKRGIPAVLVNSSMREQTRHRLFNLLFNRFLYNPFQMILTVSQQTKEYFESHNIIDGQVEVVGDTRYDQVVQRAKQAEDIIAPLRKYMKNRRCFVGGSTWPGDEDVILGAVGQLHQEGDKLWTLLVPHEPTEEHIIMIINRLGEIGLTYDLFSEITSGKPSIGDVLIVDRIGILASLYALGDISFVGGGFGQGIHSVLEPAALGNIVLFGPKNVNSFEAQQLKRQGVGFEVKTQKELYEYLHDFFANPHHLDELGKKAAAVVQTNMGATKRIIEKLTDLINI